MTPLTPDDLARGCGSPSGEHLFEDCTCGNAQCNRELCIWCEYIRTAAWRVQISALNEYDLG